MSMETMGGMPSKPTIDDLKLERQKHLNAIEDLKNSSEDDPNIVSSVMIGLNEEVRMLNEQIEKLEASEAVEHKDAA